MSELTPVSGKFLLDTNVIIAVLEGEGPAISNLKLAGSVFLPAIALGELFFGAAKSGRPNQNANRIEQFVAGLAV